MLEGTQVRLRILSPTIDSPIARTALVTIDDDAVEFSDASFYDLSGDPYRVVPARLDITGARVTYEVLESFGQFANVNDDTGFNGYEIRFVGLASNPAASLASVKVVAGSNTLDIPLENLTFNQHTLFVNVDGLPYRLGEGVSAILGFRLTGGARADRLKGDEGDDILSGGAAADRLAGLAGNDRLLGGSGKDTLLGGLGRDSLQGGAGNDRLYGDAGNDRLLGDAGNDRLFGGAGADLLNGGIGRDSLSGGAGADTLTGGAGADTFLFADGFGRDRITDFTSGRGGDRIDLSDVDSITSFRDLREDHLTRVGGWAAIDAGDGDVIQLIGVSVAELSARDFIF